MLELVGSDIVCAELRISKLHQYNCARYIASIFLKVSLLFASIFLKVSLLFASIFLKVSLLFASIFLKVSLLFASIFLKVSLLFASIFLKVSLFFAIQFRYWTSVTFAMDVILFICLRFSIQFFMHRRWFKAKTYVFTLFTITV